MYKDISPVLINRFGDREESVRLEIWATYVVLLNQTMVYGGLPENKDDMSSRGKRKRDSEESVYSWFDDILPINCTDSYFLTCSSRRPLRQL